MIMTRQWPFYNGIERRMSDRRQPLGIIRTDDEDALTDEQIKALKTLTPQQIRHLATIAEVSKSIQLVIGILSGFVIFIASINIKNISDFLGKLFG